MFLNIRQSAVYLSVLFQPLLLQTKSKISSALLFTMLSVSATPSSPTRWLLQIIWLFHVILYSVPHSLLIKNLCPFKLLKSQNDDTGKKIEEIQWSYTFLWFTQKKLVKGKREKETKGQGTDCISSKQIARWRHKFSHIRH